MILKPGALGSDSTMGSTSAGSLFQTSSFSTFVLLFDGSTFLSLFVLANHIKYTEKMEGYTRTKLEAQSLLIYPVRIHSQR